MTELDKKVIIALADNRLNTTDAGIALNKHRNSVIYHVQKIKRNTGLDPMDFHDMCKLYVMAMGSMHDRR